MGSSMVVYSQSKIINFVSKDCVPYLLGITQVKFHNHSSSSLSVAKLTFFQENVYGRVKGQTFFNDSTSFSAKQTICKRATESPLT